MFKLKVDPLGAIKTTKKNGFLRDFLVSFPDGSRDKCTIWADDANKLQGDTARDMVLAFKVDFGFAK